MNNLDKIEDIFTLDKEVLNKYYVYLVYTDEIKLIKGNEIDEAKGTELLLECRLFNEKEEIRFKRTDIGKAFIKRIIEDNDIENSDYNDCFDKSYFLDIDAARLKPDDKTSFIATGGIKTYNLPIEIKTVEIKDGKDKTRTIANTKLKIRYYLGYYEETGQAYINDWRLVGFVDCEGQEVK